MTKFALTLVAAHAFTAPACGTASEAESFGAPQSSWTLFDSNGSSTASAANDAPEAACPTPDPGQNAADLWVASFEDDPATNTSSVAVDARNNVYLTTRTAGTRKVTSDGSVQWTKPYGALVAVTPDGDVIVSGSFTDTVAIDATTLAAAGGSDVFVARLDADGNVRRAIALGTTSDETVQSLAVDRAGRVVVSGPGLGTVALDADDRPAWRRDFYGYVATDGSDDVLLTGALTGSLDFGGGSLTSAGGKDIFVVKLDEAGSHLFSRRYGDAGAAQEGQAIAADADGNILISGVFDGSVDFGSGALTKATCSSDAWCAESGFVAKLDANGTALWSSSRGPMRAITGLAVGSAGNPIVSGALPGDAAPPYRMPVVFALDGSGQKLWQKSEWPETGMGSGRGVAVDGCGSVLWSVTAKPTLDTNERAYLAKLSP